MLHKDEIGEQIEEGWQSAKRGELVDGDEIFDRIDAELAALIGCESDDDGAE